MIDYREHHEYQALLAAIRAAPGDDLPRLVMADWLEERGESERAEFVRWQVAGEVRLPSLTLLAAFESVLGAQPHQCIRGAEKGSATVSTVTPAGLLMFTFRHGFVHTVRAPLAVLVGCECARCENGAALTAREWMSGDPCPACHGTGRTEGVLPSLVRREPVEVVATDREPCTHRIRGVTRWAFWAEQEPGGEDLPHITPAARIPYRLLDWMDSGYPTREAAHSALSAAILIHCSGEVRV